MIIVDKEAVYNLYNSLLSIAKKGYMHPIAKDWKEFHINTNFLHTDLYKISAGYTVFTYVYNDCIDIIIDIGQNKILKLSSKGSDVIASFGIKKEDYKEKFLITNDGPTDIPDPSYYTYINPEIDEINYDKRSRLEYIKIINMILSRIKIAITYDSYYRLCEEEKMLELDDINMKTVCELYNYLISKVNKKDMEKCIRVSNAKTIYFKHDIHFDNRHVYTYIFDNYTDIIINLTALDVPKPCMLKLSSEGTDISVWYSNTSLAESETEFIDVFKDNGKPYKIPNPDYYSYNNPEIDDTVYIDHRDYNYYIRAINNAVKYFIKLMERGN